MLQGNLHVCPQICNQCVVSVSVYFHADRRQAFSHFDDQNRAYIVNGEYEQILIRMWSEIRRVYAMKKITIPLLGAGITDIIGTSEKNYTGLLKCILCTFRNSKFQPDKGITIILTKDAIKNINMNEIREEF